MKLRTFLLCFLQSAVLYAQSPGSFCHVAADRTWETEAFDIARMQPTSNKPTSAYTIPVVFHIIHQGGAENVADTFVFRLINELNAKYANAGVYNSPLGNNTNIRFCLADKDPAGNQTSGITRDSTGATNMYTYTAANSLPSNFPVDSLITTSYGWNTARYLNMYLVNGIWIGGATYGGYSTFPNQHGSTKDGLFLDFDYVDPADPIFYRYDVIAHEVGHYLGLYHTYEGGCYNANCMTGNDGVCDTPPDNSIDTACVANSCNTDADDASANNPFRAVALGGLGNQNDDTYNYMDFSRCVRRFTAGQCTRMVAALTNTRASLLTPGNCSGLSVALQGIENTHVTVLPNPFHSELLVHVEPSTQYAFTLYDAQGRGVYETSRNTQDTHLDLSHLSPGFYFYRLRTEQGLTTTGKILKE